MARVAPPAARGIDPAHPRRRARMRTATEPTMSVLRSEHRPHRPALRRLSQQLDVVVAMIAVTTAASVLLLVWWVPPHLVLPALSFASFVAAAIVALLACWSRTDHRAKGFTLWDIV